MNNKWYDFLVSFHKVFKVFGYIITWGGFILIVVGATRVQGFPNGFIVGVVMGSLFAFVSWLGFRNSYNKAVKARESLLADPQGQTIRARAAVIALVILASLVIFLLGKVFSVW